LIFMKTAGFLFLIAALGSTTSGCLDFSPVTVPPDTTHILAEMWGGGGGAQVCNRDQVETDTF